MSSQPGATLLCDVVQLGPVPEDWQNLRTIVLVHPPAPPPVVRLIDFSLDAILGKGSYGSMVFRGSFKGRTVAVKRALLDYVTLMSRELSIIQASRPHPNVAQYYHHETDSDFLYLALELCTASLADVIYHHVKFRAVIDAIVIEPKHVLRQITAGLGHLHALNIIHRDLKPENILMMPLHESRGYQYRWLISDFAMCKKYEYNRKVSQFDYSSPSIAIHTLGWRAPEVIRGEMKYDNPEDEPQSPGGSVTISDCSTEMPTCSLTKSVDIFALGCLYYYVLTEGFHPFGHLFEREENILENVLKMENLELVGEERDLGTALIRWMLDPEPDKRPDTGRCSMHPYFWDHEKRVAFLLDVLDQFDIMYQDPMGANSLTLEKGASEVVGGDWRSRLDKLFIEHLGELQKYDGKSVRDLLRMLRDVKRDYQDLPDDAKRLLGRTPEDVLVYLKHQFPKLLLHVHEQVLSSAHPPDVFRTYEELHN